MFTYTDNTCGRIMLDDTGPFRRSGGVVEWSHSNIFCIRLDIGAVLYLEKARNTKREKESIEKILKITSFAKAA